MRNEIIMEKVVKAGRKKDISIKIEIEEQNYEWEGVEYKQRKAFAETFGVREPLELTKHDGLYLIFFWDDKGEIKKHFGIKNKKVVYFVISEEDYKMLQQLKREINDFNKAELKRRNGEIKLKFTVRNEKLRLLDMYYDAKVFVPSKSMNSMTEEERKRYDKLLRAVKKFNGNKWHLDGYIDASEYEEGREFSLDDLEKMFSEELKKYDEHLRKIEEKKQELQRKKEEALKKAKETGKEVYIRIVDGYDGDEVYPGRDYGWVNVWEVATPDGRIIYKDDPTY
ncbi:MAG: hypothetical protein J7L43_02720 [Candidatus Aenigmarchaeota archaeon]|nr:hypothetical protein [Candidatus Aenigmarchaeota archaeon]